MRIGVDMVDVEEITNIITRSKGSFLRRAFTTSEIGYCEEKLTGKYQRYAGKLAAKEAFMKAMGTGWCRQLQWRSIEVLNNEKGAPYIVLDERVQSMLAEKGGHEVQLSILHTNIQAIAFVVIS